MTLAIHLEISSHCYSLSVYKHCLRTEKNVKVKLHLVKILYLYA